MPIEIYANASSAAPTSSWTCPDGVTRIFVECWGAGGGGGGNNDANSDGGGGGGGGAYAASWLKVTPKAVYNYVVASASRGTNSTHLTGNDGSGSWFGSPTLLFAAGGKGGLRGPANLPGPGGLPGHATGSIGQIRASGGRGGGARAGGTGKGGSGGSSAGVELFQRLYSGTSANPYSISSSNGVDGLDNQSAPAETPAPTIRAGPGGQGATLTAGGAGFRPTSGPGGGGGGCAEGTAAWGGDGYPGQVVITWIRQSPTVMIWDDDTELAGP